MIVDPAERAVHWYVLADGEYVRAQRSAVIDTAAAGLAQRIDWP